MALPIIRRRQLKEQEESCKAPAGDWHPGVASQQDGLVNLHGLDGAGPAQVRVAGGVH